MNNPTKTDVSPGFAEHVSTGLLSRPKFLSSMYFYDDAGSKLFQEIMQLPEYYLTRAEDEILRTQSDGILNNLAFRRHFNLVELGPGDGSKTIHLLRHMVDQGVDFTYCPIDISKQAMDDLMAGLVAAIPTLSVKPLVGDYFEVMQNVIEGNGATLVLFLGSNIGNFETQLAVEMLQKINDRLLPGDKLLLGSDLKKNPLVIQKAYADSKGITADFNLNLLHRINRELGGNINVDQFDFYSNYDPMKGEVRSFLVCLEEHTAFIEETMQTIKFERNELIRTELSKKYDLAQIDDLARSSNFSVVQHFLDSRNYFTDSLWVRE